MMAASWAVLAHSGAAPWVVGLLGLLFCGILIWLWGRPESGGWNRNPGGVERTG